MGYHPKKGETAETRFWAKVIKTDGCWLWTGLRRKANRRQLPYGTFKVLGKNMLVHRFSWQLHFGPIPSQAFVCHHCDNPLCVHPNHLFLGDALSNRHDCIAKDRHNRGERNPKAKLTDAAVAEIKANWVPYKRGASAEFFARKFGVSPTVVIELLQGKRWKHTIASKKL